MKPCLSYLRCSGAGQINGDTFARQDDIVARYCALSDLEYVAAYPEYGITGDSNLEGRYALADLATALENGGPKIVVIEHPDRMARGMLAGLTILDDMRKLGATVICACDGRPWTIDPADPEAVLFWSVRQIIAQYEKMRIVAKLKAARDRIRKDGRKDDPTNKRVEGQLRYGALPGEAQVIQRIIALRDGGHNPTHIASLLTIEGVPTRKGKPWSRFTIAKILKRQP